MKISQTVIALLATAILCIGLVSCESKLTVSSDSTTEDITDETTETPESITDTGTTSESKTEKETEHVFSTNPLHSTQAPAHTDISVKPTGASTTAHTTVKATTTAPSTTAVQTTIATQTTTTLPAATTAPPVTEAPAVTEPPITEQSTGIITDSEDMDSEQLVISIVNRYRVAEGINELSYSPELSAAAQIRAKELAVSFSQMRPDGSFWYTVVGYMVGENIAKGQPSADDVMNYWMNSEGYRKNILIPQYTEIGVGCYYDNATDTYYWVQLFS